MKISQLQVGQVVYNVMRRKMGNTNISDTAVFKIVVKEIDPAGQWVLASWNFNAPEKFRERSVSKWRKEKPMMVKSVMGSERLATRAEIKAAKEKKAAEVAAQTQGYIDVIHKLGEEERNG